MDLLGRILESVKLLMTFNSWIWAVMMLVCSAPVVRNEHVTEAELV
jgi:hypothetical protein